MIIVFQFFLWSLEANATECVLTPHSGFVINYSCQKYPVGLKLIIFLSEAERRVVKADDIMDETCPVRVIRRQDS